MEQKDLFLGVDTGGTGHQVRRDRPRRGGPGVRRSPHRSDQYHRQHGTSGHRGGRGPGRRAGLSPPGGRGSGLRGDRQPGDRAAWAGRPTCRAGRISDLAGDLQSVFHGVPVALANDVNGALYGEFRHGAGRGCRNLVMIALGTGVGGGVIVDGELVPGSHCGAGEIGHMVLDPAGPPCTCGGRGCLEAWAGSMGCCAWPAKPAERRQAGSATWPSWSPDGATSLTTLDLAELAEQGDAAAAGIFAWRAAAWARRWAISSTSWIRTG